ncbi:MAG: iron-sulfur cluster assembly accessory protein [Cyanobacteriota bacterium]|nr:iron-sulfur cluster assembly accessory protein [Cyanobacteriota bacterium]
MIVLTPAAATEIRRLQASSFKPDSPLRLAVKTGGCAGLYYVLEFGTPTTASDRLYESHGLSIAIDQQSDRYLEGLKLDYSEDLMGGGFRFQNPSAIASCRCGHSFSIESSQG